MSNPEWQPGAASSANPNGNQGYDQQPSYDQGNFQGQYNQPAGYPGGGMPPQKRSKTGLWVGIGCGVLLLLALLVGGGVLAFTLLNGDDKKEVPASEVSSAEKDLKGKDDKGNTNNNGGSAPAPNPAPGGNSSDSPQPDDVKNIPQPMPQPGTGGNDPQPGDGGNSPQPGQGGGDAPQPGGGGGVASGNLPQQVGSTSLDPSFGDAGIGDVGGTYVSQDMTLVYIASIINDKDTQDMFTKYGSGEKKTVGSWTCESKTTNSHTCYKQNSSGALVYIIGANAGALSPEDVTAWGDEFISKMG
ncbi:hypothetical protein HMPREF3157_01995 [Dermabacter sp. HMSC06F07]|uniref:Uncharacterized protein n=2 Tax=Dermabacter TaxID=36739 RepID=A0ABR4SHP5_9MICO|nr:MULTISPECIES: hypothetical protein [Dermabacter]KDS92527.1 hypothetical protein DHOM_10690 [Dermabacter hominis 1368]ATH97351.1 hypothetical protein COP05_09895 [Dermabacter jinjuensis]EPH15164.1 hypothetical protein HMPREF1484_00794 [Dermabacter sp. HFH0086]MCT1806511.1 hypothetical protein [Dermabacter hominis]MDK8803917.1 hypothetical protein [Dermabacter hominis]